MKHVGTAKLVSSDRMSNHWEPAWLLDRNGPRAATCLNEKRPDDFMASSRVLHRGQLMVAKTGPKRHKPFQARNIRRSPISYKGSRLCRLLNLAEFYFTGEPRPAAQSRGAAQPARFC